MCMYVQIVASLNFFLPADKRKIVVNSNKTKYIEVLSRAKNVKNLSTLLLIHSANPR